jgi:TPR repeat protein
MPAVLKQSKPLLGMVLAISLAIPVMGQNPAPNTTAVPTGTKLVPPELQQAEKGDVGAQLRTAEWLNSGISGRVDSEHAAIWFQQAADRGSADAAAELGSLYLYGHGMEVDQAKAYELIKSAADRNSLKGRTFLAQMYMHGWHVQKDEAKAHELLMSVGDKEPFALTLQGVMELEGTEKHPQKAMELFQKASEQGDSGAMLSLGEMYLFGTGVTQDFDQAAVWFHSALRMDNRAAEFRLGQMHAKGAGVPRNLTQAYALFQRAAEQGYVPAQTLCGTYNYYGFGIAKNPVAAYYWFTKAAVHSDVAKNWLRRLSAAMSPEQLQAATALLNQPHTITVK